MVDEYGCTAGGIERFYVNANGDVQPCEFVNVSFGNVNEEDFNNIYRRMRKYFRDPRTNWICCTEQARWRRLSGLRAKYTPRFPRTFQLP